MGFTMADTHDNLRSEVKALTLETKRDLLKAIQDRAGDPLDTNRR
jgi:hypothetical protein